MGKIIQLFLWTCAATVIAAGCILGLSFFRGNLSKDSLVQVVAALNGIDVQGVQLREAMINARQAPTPTYEDVVAERAKQTLELDSRENSLNRLRQQLQTAQSNLDEKTKQFDARREAFEQMLAEVERGNQDKSLAEVQQVLEVLAPEQAKDQLSKLKENGAMKDVVTIVKGMTPEKRKKILAEFTSEADKKLLSEILEELRKGEPMRSLVEQAKKGSANPAP